MRVAMRVVGALALIFGVGMLAYAFIQPGMYSLGTAASAIQITQVYTEAIHSALVAIGAILVALICTVAYYAPPEPTEG